jgi:hypothetical protein
MVDPPVSDLSVFESRECAASERKMKAKEVGGQTVYLAAGSER